MFGINLNRSKLYQCEHDYYNKCADCFKVDVNKRRTIKVQKPKPVETHIIIHGVLKKLRKILDILQKPKYCLSVCTLLHKCVIWGDVVR